VAKVILTTLLALCSASAHAAWDCLPTAPVRSAVTPAGDAWAWWCPIAPAADGTPMWRRNTFVVLAKHRDPVRYFQASLRVVAAADPVAQANAEITATMVKPPAGSVDEYEVQRLAWLACGEAIKEPWPAVFEPAPACGTAPAAPVARWVVAKAALNANPPGTRPAFPWAAGVRSTVSNGRATQDTPCDPAVGRLEGATAYFGVNGRADQVAVCTMVP